MRVLVALLLLAAVLPLPVASAASWSVQATVAVTSATSADVVWLLSGITNTRLTLPIPANSTFIAARDVDGKALSATSTSTEITVNIGSRPLTLLFKLTGQQDGAFSLFPAQVASAADSPVSIGITLPAGWTLAGYRDNDDERPDASAVFHKTGPSYVEFLALEPGHVDPGPDPRVAGNHVRREGYANLSPSGTEWTLVTTYDTDVFGREWEVSVPEGSTNVRASTSLGPLTTTPTASGVKVRTPYLVGYGLGGRSFEVSMTLPAPTSQGGAFLQSNVSVRAAEGDSVSVTATLAAGSQYAGARTSGGEEREPLKYVAGGPLSVSIAFLPPAAPDHVQFREGRFIVDAPAALEAAARATARNATELLPRSAAFAYDANDTRPFFVAYTHADIFHWEEGFYSNGLNTISIRASTLANASDARAHLVPVGILLHEATHGLLDRAIPDAPHNLSFLHEGLSRLAETQAEASFPDEIVVCRTTQEAKLCDRHSARPGATDIQARYQAGTTFDLAWGATTVPEADRGALYDYSGMVFNTYVQLAPQRALENAILHIARTQFSGTDAQNAAVLTDILLSNAPGTSAQALLYPGATAAGLPADQFRYCLSTILAPPYDWEPVRAPPQGCPAMGYGGRDASLPPPPDAPQDTNTAATPATPVSPPPRVSPPQTVTSSPAKPTSGSVPGVLIEDPPEVPTRPEQVVNVQVPGAPVALVLALVAAMVVLRRR